MTPSEPSSAAGDPRPPGTYAWHPRVASRTLDGTAFVLLESSMVSLNPVGTHIWEICREGASLAQVAEAVAREFEITEADAAQDAGAFIGDLVNRGLLVAHGPAPRDNQE